MNLSSQSNDLAGIGVWSGFSACFTSNTGPTIDTKIEKTMLFDGKKKAAMVFKEEGSGNRDKITSSYSPVAQWLTENSKAAPWSHIRS